MNRIIETTFDMLERENYESVTDFCRYLISTGGRFENIQIHVYRGDMLCLKVNDIYKASQLYPRDRGGWQKHRSRKGVQAY